MFLVFRYKSTPPPKRLSPHGKLCLTRGTLDCIPFAPQNQLKGNVRKRVWKCVIWKGNSTFPGFAHAQYCHACIYAPIQGKLGLMNTLELPMGSLLKEQIIQPSVLLGCELLCWTKGCTSASTALGITYSACQVWPLYLRKSMQRMTKLSMSVKTRTKSK